MTQKIALVTGGTSGIGFAVAKKLKDNNYQVCITGRSQKKVEAAASEIGAVPLLADIKDPNDITRLAAQFKDSGLDVLINNAGIAKAIPIDACSVEFFDEYFYTNVRGPLLLIRYLLGALEARKGSITTVSSIITRRGAPGFATYAATKGAIEAFTKSLAKELAPRSVRINAVSPGAIDTPIFSKMGIPEESWEVVQQQILSTIPMGRFGVPEEVAEVILAQIEASYVTGSVWAVDGGVDT